MEMDAFPLGLDGRPWQLEEHRTAFQDFWELYERHLRRFDSRGWVAQHPELGKLGDHLDVLFGELNTPTSLPFQRAKGGDWSDYRNQLARQGAVCAEGGATLRAACDLARASVRQVLPHLVEGFAAQPARLCAALQALNDFADHRADVVGEAYLSRKESELRAREEDLETTLNSIGDGVVVTDAAGRIVRLNPVAERLMGYVSSECAGRPLAEVFRIQNEATGEPVESPVARVLERGVVVGLANHTVLVARDGAARPIADSAAPIRHSSGELRGVVLVFRDVTDERRSEEALRHWERIFQHANWGVALATTKDVRFQAVNPAYAAMHGYTVEELLGAPVSTLWGPETKADMEAHAVDTHETGRLVVETVHLCKDGSRLPVELVATTIKDSRGEVAWFVANVQDITERKRLQQARALATDLEAQNRRIEEANRLKSEFLASMSHELRTPLNSIIGFTELIHDARVGEINSKQQEFLADILSSGRHLLGLINDVLDLAKVEAGKMEFRPEPVDLAALARAVIQSLHATRLEKGLEVELVFDPMVDDVVLDPARFKQVLYNYLSNALKFTQDGGRIEVRILPDTETSFRLEVEDSGIGVSPEGMPRLFVAFQQLDSGAARRHGGTGLGLALTRRLAEAQGGRVGMRPAPKQGSIFFAVMPRRPLGKVEVVERRADRPRLGCALAVEAGEHDRNVTARLLGDLGFQVDVAVSVAAALKAWEGRAYEVVTIDLDLADSSDLPLLLRLVRSDTRKHAPAVIGTGVASRWRGDEPLPIGEVLPKPLESGALLSALTRLGALPSRERPVLVLDDDPSSLRLMEATLAKLGCEALCFSDAADALRALERVRPAALVVDLVMPGMGGLEFLDRVRASPTNRGIPVLIWTVKDLSTNERLGLQAAVDAVVQKGVADGTRLSRALEALLPRGGSEEPNP